MRPSIKLSRSPPGLDWIGLDKHAPRLALWLLLSLLLSLVLLLLFSRRSSFSIWMLLGSSLRRVHGNGKVVLFLFVILSRGKKTPEHQQLANGGASSVAALDEPAQREASERPLRLPSALCPLLLLLLSCSLAPATCPHLFVPPQPKSPSVSFFTHCPHSRRAMDLDLIQLSSTHLLPALVTIK